MMFKTTLTTMAAAALLAACATPAMPPTSPAQVPPTFAQAQGLPAGAMPRADWWTVLGDPVLDDLVVRGLAANLDLAQAAERVQRSRALASGRQADLWPSGGIGLDAQARRLSATQAPGLAHDARRQDLVSSAVDLQWEIDLFGRLRRHAQAADARSEAVVADADALALAVAGEIAQAWFALEGVREQLTLARGAIDNRRATLAVVQRRTAAGYSASFDEARARAELAAAQSEVAPLEAAATVASHRLAVLLGSSPSAFEPPPSSVASARPALLRIPEPAQWVALRPDLRAAEATLRAHAIDVEAVRTEFMPRLSVGGVLGFVAGSVSGLGAAGSASWLVAPSVSVPLFDHRRIEARVEAAKAQQREALLAYRQRVLLATEEVESALVRVRQAQAQLVSLRERTHQAETAEGLARRRFDAGASDLLELLDAQRGAQQARQQLSAALTGQRQQVVLLQHALGARFLAAETDQPGR